jgi:N-acyl-D-amino-acid deacylase
MSANRFFACVSFAFLAGCTYTPAALQSSATAMRYDVLIRGGMIYDGSGSTPYKGDVGIANGRIAYVGLPTSASGSAEIAADGLAVAPGFINMLSWANESLLADGRAQSDVRQGITLEVMGEGASSGPLTPAMKAEAVRRQGDIKYDVNWTTLGEYLEYLEKRGVSPNVASFVGAATVRVHELGEGDVDPNPAQLKSMQRLVRQAMQEGAMGVGSSLIYAPDSYAETDELVALASEAAKCSGMYISHLRSEADRLLPAIDELIEISRRSGAPAEIYHLKQAGKANWAKLDDAIARVESARAKALKITANMYSCTAGATGLDAVMPPWVQSGGQRAWIARLKEPATRQRVIQEMRTSQNEWENLLKLAGGADKVLLIGFKTPALKPLVGKTLAEVAQMRGKSAEDTAIDLVIEDGSRVEAVFFLMSEDNVRRQIALPWMSFGSDEIAGSTEGVFLMSKNHPRAYGNFARVLGHYVRDQNAALLADVVRRLTLLPATNMGLRDRGALKIGYHADIAMFDPATINDRATYAKPQQYAVGMRHVFVNGVQVLKDGEHTGAAPGMVVRGRGWTGWPGGGACLQ